MADAAPPRPSLVELPLMFVLSLVLTGCFTNYLAEGTQVYPDERLSAQLGAVELRESAFTRASREKRA